MATPSKTHIQVSTSRSFDTIVGQYQGAYTTAWTLPPDLDYNTTYYIRARHAFPDMSSNDIFGDFGGINMFTTQSSAINKPSKPTITAPKNKATDVATRPLVKITASANATSTEIQIAKDTSFIAIVTKYSGDYTQSWQVPTDLLTDTTYYVRGYHSNPAGTSDPSAVVSFKTTKTTPIKPGVIPDAPTILAPLDGSRGVSFSPTVTLSATTQASDTWIQVSTDGTFEVVDAEYKSTYVRSWLVFPALTAGAKYFVRAKYSNQYGESAWSTVISFTTTFSSLATPSIIEPAHQSTNISVRPTVVTSSSDVATKVLIQISEDSLFETLAQSFAGDYTDTWTLTKALAEKTKYFIRCYHYTDEASSDPSLTSNFTTAEAPPLDLKATLEAVATLSLSMSDEDVASIEAPTITYPANNEKVIPPDLTITLSDFVVNGTVTDAPAGTTIEVAAATDSKFANPLWTYDGEYTVEQEMGIPLTEKAQYRIRARHKGQVLGESGWSTVNLFSTDAAPPPPEPVDLRATLNAELTLSLNMSDDDVAGVQAPFIIYPENNSSNINYRTHVEFSEFEVKGDVADTPENTQFEITISADKKYEAPTYTYDGPYITDDHYGDIVLLADTQYRIHARHSGVILGYGPWSKEHLFTTQSATPPRPEYVDIEATLAANSTLSASMDESTVVISMSAKFTINSDLSLDIDDSDVSKVKTPTITYPANNSNKIPIDPTIIISSFAVDGTATDTPAGTRIQVTRTADTTFASIVWEYNGAYVTEKEIDTPLTLNTQYRIRAKHSGTNLGESSWSPVVLFTTGTPAPFVIQAPTVLAPVASSSSNLLVGFTVSDLSVTGGTANGEKTEVEFVKNSTTGWTLSTIKEYAYADHTVTTEFPVPVLDQDTSVDPQTYKDTVYKVRARQKDAVGGWSPYSEVVTWTVKGFTIGVPELNVQTTNIPLDMVPYTLGTWAITAGDQSKSEFDMLEAMVIWRTLSGRTTNNPWADIRQFPVANSDTGAFGSGQNIPTPPWNTYSFMLANFRGIFGEQDAYDHIMYQGSSVASPAVTWPVMDGVTASISVPPDCEITFGSSNANCTVSYWTQYTTQLGGNYTVHEPVLCLAIYKSGASLQTLDKFVTRAVPSTLSMDSFSIDLSTLKTGNYVYTSWFNILLTGDSDGYGDKTRVLCSSTAAAHPFYIYNG